MVLWRDCLASSLASLEDEDYVVELSVRKKPAELSMHNNLIIFNYI